jgi:prolyl oligopeptidase
MYWAYKSSFVSLSGTSWKLKRRSLKGLHKVTLWHDYAHCGPSLCIKREVGRQGISMVKHQLINLLFTLLCVFFLAPLHALAGDTSASLAADHPFLHLHWIFFSVRDPQGGWDGFVQNGIDGSSSPLTSPARQPGLRAYYLNDLSVSGDGRYLTYFTAAPGSVLEEVHVLEVGTGRPLTDVLQRTRFTDIAWEGRGFYYAAYPKGTGAKLENQRVYYHRLGDPQDRDSLVYEDPTHPDLVYTFLTSYDEKTLFLHVTKSLHGADSEAFYFRRKGSSTFTPIVAPLTTGREFLCDDVPGGFLVHTTYQSPRGRVVLVDPNQPAPTHWTTVVPENDIELVSADTAGGKLFLSHGHAGVATQVSIADLRGHLEGELSLPADIKSVEVQAGRSDDKFVFVRMTTEAVAVLYRYEIDSHRLIPFDPGQTK